MKFENKVLPSLSEAELLSLAHEKLSEAIRDTKNSVDYVESVIQQLSSSKQQKSPPFR